jgi:hypothetical protein
MVMTLQELKRVIETLSNEDVHELHMYIHQLSGIGTNKPAPPLNLMKPDATETEPDSQETD